MEVEGQESISWSSIRAWEGLKQKAFRAFCVEWIRHESVTDDAQCEEYPGNDLELGIHWIMKDGAECHWLSCDDVDFFGIQESRALTARTMQYVILHPHIIRLTFALPYPLATRVSEGHPEEQQEWRAFLTRCEYLMRAQGRIILFSYWDDAAWHMQWQRLKRQGTLALWFTSTSLSTDWMESQTKQVISRLPSNLWDRHLRRNKATLWLDAWFREESYYQKVIQLRRKCYRMTQEVPLFSFSNANMVHEHMKRMIATLRLPSLNQVDNWDNQEAVASLDQLQDQFSQALMTYDKASTAAEKDQKKALLRGMRLLMEIRQWMGQAHWRVFHMPYLYTSYHSPEEVRGFEAMMQRGLQRKYPLLALWDDGKAFYSLEQWIESTLGISCPPTVLWETLQEVGEKLNATVYLVIITRASYTEREWQSWTSELVTQWMKYPRLSCWIHRVS